MVVTLRMADDRLSEKWIKGVWDAGDGHTEEASIE
jgi:hypothetical protein